MMRASIEMHRAAVATQRQAARRQAESMGARLLPAVKPAFPIGPAADCEPVGEMIVSPIIEVAAKTNNLPPDLLRSVIQQESAFLPCAVSSSGAQGLMQLMPATAGELGVQDPFDPRQNVSAGARYLKQLMEKYGGNVFRALSAYNAGPAVVDQVKGIPDIVETRNYVHDILERVSH